MSRSLFTLLALAVAALLPASTARAQITAAERRQIEAMNEAVSTAGRLYLQQKFNESGEAIRGVQAEYEKLAESANSQVNALLEPVYNRLMKAHALLELEGIALPPLKQPDDASEPMPDTPPVGDGVSFVKQVAPILVTKCGRCHVSDAKGQFSAANFTSLMKGSEGGTVIFAGDPVGSRLIEVIEQGDMPRGGLKVTQQELSTLKQWIAEGAKFDGADPQASLTSLTSATAGEVAKVEVMQSTGKETVSFANDIAPVLNEKCSNCHGRGNRPSGGLNMVTFAGLLRGGESGPPIVPKRPAESLLIKKLKGMASGERMPLNQPPLPNDVIAKIETWIAEGATFDGPDPAQDIEQVANLAKAQRLSHDELAAERVQGAMKNWALGMPGIQADQVETENFFVIGNVGPETLKSYAQTAESLVPKVAEVFGAPADKPLIKGRITLFVFGQRYDYSEFGRMVEKRDLPDPWRGHWRYNVIDAYAAVIPSRTDAYSLDGLIGQQIAGAYIASLGSVPHWFAEGSARVAASRIAKDDPRVAGWDEQLSDALSKMGSPDDFLTGKLAQEAGDIASYDFVKFLMTDAARYRSLLTAVKNGAAFDEAFSKAYGGSPAQVADVWVKRAGRSSSSRTRR